MPRGGARKGAGRKPKPLHAQLESGNGGRPLTAVTFEGEGAESQNPKSPPSYLNLMERASRGTLPTPIDLYHEIVDYLKPSECLNLIPSQLLSDYVMAKYYLLCAQQELSLVPNVIMMSQGDRNSYKTTEQVRVMFDLQKNVLATWSPIWEIVSKNARKMIINPNDELIAMFVTARKRKGQTNV